MTCLLEVQMKGFLVLCWNHNSLPRKKKKHKSLVGCVGLLVQPSMAYKTKNSPILGLYLVVKSLIPSLSHWPTLFLPPLAPRLSHPHSPLCVFVDWLLLLVDSLACSLLLYTFYWHLDNTPTLPSVSLWAWSLSTWSLVVVVVVFTDRRRLWMNGN